MDLAIDVGIWDDLQKAPNVLLEQVTDILGECLMPAGDPGVPNSRQTNLPNHLQRNRYVQPVSYSGHRTAQQRIKSEPTKRGGLIFGSKPAEKITIPHELTIENVPHE